jgi:DNA ligase D-like protein (predicted 3'-phosphoesterase)
MPRGKLNEYRIKRDFRRTSEPSGEKKSRQARDPIFVIQKHDARSLHYDFRLEADGVLKSWAVPKGPSTNPADKHLAIHVEDHPLDYAGFEGIIPEGEYGAGTVMIWDKGTYTNLRHKKDGKIVKMTVTQSINDGLVEVWLEGQKLHGGYALIRTGSGDRERWLMVKMRDEAADARRNPVKSQTKSAATGRTLKQIEKEEKRKLEDRER